MMRVEGPVLSRPVRFGQREVREAIPPRAVEKPVSHEGRPAWPVVPALYFGRVESMARLKRQTFERIQPFLPAPIPDETLSSVTPKDIRTARQAHFETWLAQFKPADRRAALQFLSKLTYIDHPRLLSYLRRNHDQLLRHMKADGFAGENGDPLEKADFTTLYQASSGDLIAYFYRKINRIPKVKFFDQSDLATNGQDKSDRALVIVDDYIGTGAQLLAEAYALGKTLPQNRYLADLVKAYKKVYFVVVAANRKAVERFQKIEDGRIEEATREILAGYHGERDRAYTEPIKQQLGALHKGKMQLLHAMLEEPLFSPGNPRLNDAERRDIKAFLERNNVYKYPFGVGQLEGSTVFFYSTPNTLPDILWNSKIHPWKPLFHRLEDVSAYWFANAYDLPKNKQIW